MPKKKTLLGNILESFIKFIFGVIIVIFMLTSPIYVTHMSIRTFIFDPNNYLQMFYSYLILLSIWALLVFLYYFITIKIFKQYDGYALRGKQPLIIFLILQLNSIFVFVYFLGKFILPTDGLFSTITSSISFFTYKKLFY